jgi:colanic acid/amylovoran biosynthesis glycosyltransferase
MVEKRLVVISPLAAGIVGSGKIILTQKFVDGMAAFQRFWNGPILHVCEPAVEVGDSLDNIEIEESNSSFQTSCVTLSAGSLNRLLTSNSVVLTTVGEKYNMVSRICRARDIPCIYVTEYNLKTRNEIAGLYQRNPLHGIWSKLRQVEQEFKQRKAISISSGVQCNGLPTFEAYRTVAPSSLLFFDSRIEPDMLVSDDQLAFNSQHRHQSSPIRLVFSGRLSRIKGVDDLPAVAAHLCRMRVPFEMHICGEGEYSAKLDQQITESDLRAFVKLTGTLDFKKELMPFVAKNADIFICCHRQGDPSCTYLETMACGVPIVGYANDAFQSLARYSGVGWVTPMGDPLAMATQIANLYGDLTRIDKACRDARVFAGDHTFGATFKRRADHIKQVANISS